MNDDIRELIAKNAAANTNALKNVSENSKAKINDNLKNEEIIGYFINFGVTTCRLFEVLKNQKGLKPY